MRLSTPITRLPRATIAIVGYTAALPSAPTGTLTQGATVTNLTFSRLNDRWESQSVPLTPGGGTVTATLIVDGEEFASVTYTKLG